MTKSLHPDDPMALVGVQMSQGPDDQALAEMAWCIVEEYARMGWSGERILRLFRNPAYRGPYQVLQVKGEEFVLGLIEQMERARSRLAQRARG